jgi:hypothetical protein
VRESSTFRLLMMQLTDRPHRDSGLSSVADDWPCRDVSLGERKLVSLPVGCCSHAGTRSRGTNVVVARRVLGC